MSDRSPKTRKTPRTTTDAGIPASSDEYSLSVGPGGPLLLQDHYLIQKMAQFNRERVPERVVHAKGGGEIMRSAYEPNAQDDDFVQPRALWTQVLSETDREHLVGNLVRHLKAGVEPEIQARAVEYWRQVHPDLGGAVAGGLGLSVGTAAPSGKR